MLTDDRAKGSSAKLQDSGFQGARAEARATAGEMEEGTAYKLYRGLQEHSFCEPSPILGWASW